MADMNRTKRKRARARDENDDDDSDESKKRGRPRVEKQDESAADRRRTQIRMAQRAYRQRKESTLDDLRRRVADITGAVEAANEAFQGFRSRLAASGLSTTQLHELQRLSQHFENLTNIVHNEQNVLPAPPTILTPPSSSKSHDGEDLQSIEGNVPKWSHQASPSHKVHKSEVVHDDTQYSDLPSNAVDVSLEMSNLKYDRDPLRHMAQSTQQSSSDGYRSMTPESVGVPHSLPPPSTYSFQETSFARRLHRAGLEAGYHLLLNRSKRPKCYERIFQLSLMGRPQEKLAASFRSVLDRDHQDSLEFWEAPLIHIGGAGTHYPRRNQFGEIQPKKTSYHIGLVGPQTLANLENAARDNLSTDMTVEIAGFEGEWLDPYDVAGYLEEKGIFIDPWSSVVEAEAIEWPANSAGMSDFFSSIQPAPKFSTSDRSSAFDMVQLQILTRINADFSKWNDLNPMTFSGVGHSQATSASWINFSGPQFNTSASNPALNGHGQFWGGTGMLNAMQDIPQNTSMPRMLTDPVNPVPVTGLRRKIVYIDVMRFIRTLIVGTVCLGRTPGYRRRDVDRALAMSSFDIST